jgi:transcription initiation factor TFIIE subunit alpha
MPQHFTHSTITGEQVKFGGQTSVQASQTLGIEDKKDVDTLSANGDPSEIDNYFAQLKAEQAKEAEKEQEEEDDDDSEDEEEDFGFEDVMTGSAAATPATSTPTGGDDGRSTKKIKVEDHEESDEDNIEFEDV